MSTTHTPEPWTLHESPIEGWPEDHFLVSGDSEPDDINIVIYSGPERQRDIANWQRCCACVNAFAGISDPVAALQKVRELLARIIYHTNPELEEDSYRGDSSNDALDYAFDKAEQALALLTPNK